MNNPHIGVANSISANFNFDPIDTINYARQSQFEIIQIFLNQNIIEDSKLLETIQSNCDGFKNIYYHADGQLNSTYFESDYRKQLYHFLEIQPFPNYIIHFDERENLNSLLKTVEKLNKETPVLFIENYFMGKGKDAAEKNLKKFTALFTLANTGKKQIFPVLDIPRFFHHNLEFTREEALQWCYEIFNYFGNRNSPILLHLVDYKNNEQTSKHLCPLGEGYIPYNEIFQFIVKTKTEISCILFEFEDKISPLKSREYLKQYFKF